MSPFTPARDAIVSFVDAGAFVVEVVAAVVIIAAVARAVVDLGDAWWRPRRHAVARLRLRFGRGLVLGLEFLVAADILRTVLAPELDAILEVAALIVVRTVLAVAIEWELRHVHEEPEPEDV